MTDRTCSTPGCERKHRTRGYCATCYQRERRRGNIPHQTRPTREQRFWGHVNKTGSCWMWAAHVSKEGYGKFQHSYNNPVLAHRFVWELTNGPIPDGHEIDHKCHNRACVNPGHLRIATRKENAEHHQGALRTSKSGVRGVHWSSHVGKWRAQVQHNKHTKTVGYFDSVMEAEAAVVQARVELHTRNDRDRQQIDGAA